MFGVKHDGSTSSHALDFSWCPFFIYDTSIALGVAAEAQEAEQVTSCSGRWTFDPYLLLSTCHGVECLGKDTACTTPWINREGCVEGIQCKTPLCNVGLSTILVQTEISQQLSDGWPHVHEPHQDHNNHGDALTFFKFFFFNHHQVNIKRVLYMDHFIF